MGSHSHSLDQRRYLKAMGIPLWELRAASGSCDTGSIVDDPDRGEVNCYDRGQLSSHPQEPPINNSMASARRLPDTNPDTKPVSNQDDALNLASNDALTILQDPVNAQVIIVTVNHTPRGESAKLLTAMLKAIELPITLCVVVEVPDATAIDAAAFTEVLASRAATVVMSLLHTAADDIEEGAAGDWVNQHGEPVLRLQGFRLSHLLEHPSDKRTAWNQLKTLRAHLSAKRAASVDTAPV